MPPLAGFFLVAKPVLQDPNFEQTVVLVLRHGLEGAFGLVVNRPAQAEGLLLPVFSGGPCPAPGLIMLHGHSEWAAETAEDDGPGEVAAGIFVGNAECMDKIPSESEEQPAVRYRVFLGYSGWGPDQLERELASGAWLVVPATGELLFDTPIEQLWDRLSPPATPRPSLN